MLKIDKIKIGMKVASYRALCRLLEEPIKEGNSKNAQLKEFARYFSFTRSGNAFVIDEIYPVPKEQQDGRQKYIFLIEPILLNFFANYCFPEADKTWNNWFQVLGMVNERFYDDDACEEQVDFWWASSYSLYRLKNIAKNNMRDILKSALSNMKKRNLIDYKEQWRIVDRDGGSRVAHEKEACYIEERMQLVIEEMGYSSIQSVVLSPKKYKEFSEKSREVILKDSTWRFVFKELRIQVVGDAAAPYEGVDVDSLKKELNRRICSAVRVAAHQRVENREKKELQLWDDGDLGEESSRFLFTHDFGWDAEVFVDQLMVL